MNGLKATRIISAELPEARINGLSINADAETVAAMIEAGAVCHLAKDCDSCSLFKTIHHCSIAK